MYCCEKTIFKWESVINKKDKFGETFKKILEILIVILGFVVYLFSGQYKGLAIYEGSRAIYLIIIRNGFLITTLYIINLILNLNLISSKELLLLWLILIVLNIFIRFALRDLLINILKYNSSKKRIIIYGAGAAAALLASNLLASKKYVME